MTGFAPLRVGTARDFRLLQPRATQLGPRAHPPPIRGARSTAEQEKPHGRRDQGSRSQQQRDNPRRHRQPSEDGPRRARAGPGRPSQEHRLAHQRGSRAHRADRPRKRADVQGKVRRLDKRREKELVRLLAAYRKQTRSVHEEWKARTCSGIRARCGRAASCRRLVPDSFGNPGQVLAARFLRHSPGAARKGGTGRARRQQIRHGLHAGRRRGGERYAGCRKDRRQAGRRRHGDHRGRCHAARHTACGLRRPACPAPCAALPAPL